MHLYFKNWKTKQNKAKQQQQKKPKHSAQSSLASGKMPL